MKKNQEAMTNKELLHELAEVINERAELLKQIALLINQRVELIKRLTSSQVIR